MMRVDIASDLHLRDIEDIGDVFFETDASVLALLGDVCEVQQLESLKPFFDRVCATWENVIYVLGNHEFYGTDIDLGISEVKNFMMQYDNVHVADNDCIRINGVVFIGSTLWSSMNDGDPLTIRHCRQMISDYHHIFKKNIGSITPQMTANLFDKSVEYIKEYLKIFEDESKVVVLTHHAPSFKSVTPKFKGQLTNGAFVSNLEHVIVESPNLKIWAHGHCHSESDYRINHCRVVCHPKGYSGENYPESKTYKPLRIEV
jgi:Icc-related predicted phosphoesterase